MYKIQFFLLRRVEKYVTNLPTENRHFTAEVVAKWRLQDYDGMSLDFSFLRTLPCRNMLILLKTWRSDKII